MTQFHRLLATIGAVFFFISAQAQLDVDFTFSDSTGCGNLQVNFCDATTTDPGNYIVSWNWNIGGAPSTLECPTRVFGTPGSYTVCLTVIDNLGNTDFECKSNKIKIFHLPEPEFTGTPTLDCAPATVTYTDMSTSIDGSINEWVWGLGGSCGTITQNTSQTPAAVCTYDLADTYTISLTVKDDNGCENTITKADYINVPEAPAASIAASSTFGCEAPFTVSFLNTSNNASNLDFEWDFGDGGLTTHSGENPPDVTYSFEGSYTITLIATDPLTNCSDTLILPDYITVGYPMDFEPSLTEGCEGTTVSFTDNSANVADFVEWDFGDGNISNEPDPSHTFMQSGCYFVKLTRTVGGCVNSQFFPTCINIEGPPSFNTNNDNNSGCSLPHVVNFSSISSGASSWEWVFGDGSPSSTDQNPTHSYTTFGDFDVYIVGTNSLGCVDSVFVNTISVTPVEAILTDDDISGCAPMEVTLGESSQTITAITDWHWELATTSNTFISFSQNPTFTIPDTGCFDVTLTVTNTLGCSDTQTFTDAICIGDNPTLNFSATPVESCVEQAITFTDLSDNTVDYWFWDFGDGNDTEEQNPTHFYLDTGYYDINLIAASNGCFTSLTFDEYIHITAPVSKYTVIKFCDNNLARTFKNNAIGADSIFWDFGVSGMTTDTSTLENPDFIYPAPGTYTVTQTVFNSTTGCMHSRTEEVVVTNPISDFNPSELTGCAPMTLTLEDQSQDAEFYYWSSPDGVISDENTASPTITFDSPGAYTDVQLIIKDINNCRDTFVMPQTILVNEVDADIVAVPTAGCEPLAVNFFDNSNNLYSSNSTWTWDFDDNGMTSDVENPTYTFNEAGSYTVTLTVTDNWGCTDDVVIDEPIIVTAPIVFFEAQELEGCPGNPISFTNMSDGENLTYEWDFGDGESSTEEFPQHTYSSEGTYSVCLTITDEYGCETSQCFNNYISIDVPSADFTLDNAFASCPPLEVNFTNLSADAVSYIWDFGDNSGLSTLDNPTHIYTVPGSYEVTLIAVNAAGCQDTMLVDDLVVLDGPEGNFTMDVSEGCAPLTVTLTGESVANYEYTWDAGNGLVEVSPFFVDQDTVVITYTEPGTYTPTLSLENATGCFRTLPPIGEIKVSEIEPDFTADETLFCDNNQVINFYNLSSSPNPFTSAQWFFENGSPATVNNIEAATIFPGMGSYDVTMIISDGICTDTITKQDYINIGASPVADFGMDVISGCEPLEISFTDLSTIPAGSITNWSWNFGDGTFSDAPNPTHTFAAGDDIDVVLEVTSDQGCTHTFTQTVDVYAATELISSGDMSICIGETAHLEVLVMGDTTGSTFAWSPAAGLSCTSCLDPIADPASTTMYTFTMTNALGCTSDVEVEVEVQPSTLPVVDIIPDTSVCLNSGIELYADAGAGTYTYQWDNVSTLDCNDCATPIANPNVITTYTVIVTNEFGCSSTASVTVDVINDNQPFAGEDRLICEGSSVQLEVTMGNNPVWLTTTGLSCSNCPSPTASPTTPTMYLVQVTTDNGCDIIDSVYVDIFNPQSIDAGDNVSICNGETILLSGYGFGEVTWHPTDNLTDPGIINPYATPTETTTYYMTISNGDCVATDSLTVEVTESTDIELNDVTICEGQSVELDIQGNADQFEWLPVPGLSDYSSGNPIASPLDTTEYTVIASFGACYPDTETVVVNVIPIPEIDVVEATYFFPGQSIQVNAEVTGNGFYGYTWSPSSGVNCITCNDPVISPPNDSMVYTLEVLDFNTGCVAIDTTSFIEMSTCPPELITVPNAFSPNGDGLNDQLEIFLAPNMRSSGIVSFRVFDRWGAQMFESNDINILWDGRYRGKTVDNGVYLYYIEYLCPIDGSIQIKRGDVTVFR